MESKKTFGEFIQLKRKEAGLTQKGLADKLYVSESAVSKWERGLSYPDITLIKDICESLHISYHELLTASEDTQTRTNEKLMARYTKLIRQYKLAQYVIYGSTILICFICNLAAQHTLSWFLIVLTSVMTMASLTLLPMLVEKYRGIITLLGFTFSLLLLLFVCNHLTSGDWFLLNAVSVVYGICLIFLPLVLRSITLPVYLSKHKALICTVVDTVLLFPLLSVCGYNAGDWFMRIALPTTAFWLVLPWGMLLIIRYVKMHNFFKVAACLGLSSLMFYLSDRITPLILNGVTRFGWDNSVANGNENILFFIVMLGLTIAFTVAGIIITIKSSRMNNADNNNE